MNQSSQKKSTLFYIGISLTMLVAGSLFLLFLLPDFISQVDFTEIEIDQEEAENETLDMSFDFTLPSLEGEEVSFSEYRGKTPVVLIFWTSWNEVSLQQVKLFDKALGGMSSKDVGFLAINNQEKEERVMSTVRDYNIEHTNVLLDKMGDVGDRYRIGMLPSILFFDSSGKLVLRLDESIDGHGIQRYLNLLLD